MEIHLGLQTNLARALAVPHLFCGDGFDSIEAAPSAFEQKTGRILELDLLHRILGVPNSPMGFNPNRGKRLFPF